MCVIMKLKYLLSQVNPSPSKGEVQVHVKLAFNTLSLAHSALVSHGPELQGSGTVVGEVQISIQYTVSCTLSISVTWSRVAGIRNCGIKDLKCV